MTVPWQPEAGMEWSSQGLNPTCDYCDLCGYYHATSCDDQQWGGDDGEED